MDCHFMYSDHAIIDIGMGLSRLTHEGVPTGRASEFLDNMHKRKDGISPFALRGFWSVHMVDFCPALASVAGRALCMHATSCASERNWSTWGWTYSSRRNRLDVSKAEKLIYVQRNSSEPFEVQIGEDELLELLGEQNQSDATVV